jgi:hypothetical protein
MTDLIVEIKKLPIEEEFSNIANAYFTNNEFEFKKLAFEFFFKDDIKIDYNYDINSKMFHRRTRCIRYPYTGNESECRIDKSKIFESYCNLIKIFLINKMSNIKDDNDEY